MVDESAEGRDQRSKTGKKILPIAIVSLISLLVIGIAAYAAVYLAKNIGKVPPE